MQVILQCFNWGHEKIMDPRLVNFAPEIAEAGADEVNELTKS